MVYIANPFTIPTEAAMGALHDFAMGAKRYQEATRFVSFYTTVISSNNYFGQWIYDRNQETIYWQSSPDGKTDWGGFAGVEMVGVTDVMITRAAQDKSNSVFDLLRFGATRRRIWWKGRWVVIPKSDPRVAARRTEFLNKETEIEAERVNAPAKSRLQLDLKKAMKQR